MSNLSNPTTGPRSEQPAAPFGAMQFAASLAPFARSVQLPGGLRLAFADSGPSTGDAVLLVHGLQDEADTWRHVFTPLSQAHRVIALDLPGFGRSDKPRIRYDLNMFSEAACGLLDALGIARAHWIGSSLGAMICEHVALRRSERVQSLTLVDGSLIISKPPPTPPGALLRMLFADYFDRRFFAALRRAPDDAYATLTPYYADLAGLPADDREFLYRRVNQRVWDEAQRVAALSTRSALTPYLIRNAGALRTAVKNLRMPTHIVWGENDRIMSSANGRARAALQPNAKCIEIDRCGHLPQQERPSGLLNALPFT